MDFLHHLENMLPWVLSLILVWIRFFTFFFTTQLFRQLQVTPRVLNILAFSLSFFVVYVYPEASISKEFIQKSELPTWIGLVIRQCLVGFLLSSILNIATSILVSAGQIISAQLGLTFASLIDPKLGYVTNLTQFYVLSATILFFMSPLFLDLINILIQSVKWIPFSGDLHWDENKRWLISLFSNIYSKSVQLALPIILVAILCQIGMMTISRFAPQFNMMSIGTPLLLITCLFFVFLSFPNFLEEMLGVLTRAVRDVDHFSRGGHV